MMSLTFGLFTQVSGSGPLGPLVCPFVNLTSFLIAYVSGTTHQILFIFGS